MKSLRILILLTIYSSGIYLYATNLSSKKHNLSICSIFNNEAKFLKEWIEYHKLVGVDHFYLYNLSSSDRYMTAIKPYMKEGLITLIHWPDLSKNIKNESVRIMSTQIPAYENAIRVKACKETNWLVFVEINEFLVPPEHCDLKEILEKCNEFPAVILETHYYDAAQLSAKKLIIETVQLSHSLSFSKETSVMKAIFKPEQIEHVIWPPYQFIFKDNQAPITLKKYELRINQYINRKSGSSTQNFRERVKLDPCGISEKDLTNLLKAGYEIEDSERAIQRFIPELHRKMGIAPTWD
jgi:hypothetical protein